MKYCRCGNLLVRRKTEAYPVFAKRRACSVECGLVLRRKEKKGWYQGFFMKRNMKYLQFAGIWIVIVIVDLFIKTLFKRNIDDIYMVLAMLTVMKWVGI